MTITIYTTRNCPKCKILKIWLKENNIEHKEKDLGDSNVMSELMMKDVFITSVPFLDIDGKFVMPNEVFNGNELNKNLFSKFLEGSDEKERISRS